MAKRNHKPQPHSAAKLNAQQNNQLNSQPDEKLSSKPDRTADKEPNTETTGFPYQRQFKVRKSHYDYQYADFRFRRISPEPVPWINIKGYWLKQAGFPIGTELQVTIRPGEIVIAVASDDRPGLN